MTSINKELWNYKEVNQNFTSKETSINANKLPSTVKKISNLIKKDSVWADIGGGRFDNGMEYFKSCGAKLYIYDPFNRTKEFNEITVKNIADGKCDGVMVNNVLNVIIEEENRKQVINQAFNCLKEGGVAFFKIYEGNKSGITKMESKGNDCAQLNQKALFFFKEISDVFGVDIKIKGDILEARKGNELVNEKDKNIELEKLFKDSKKIGCPQRYNKTGVGKFIGGSLYIHKNYVDILPQQEYKKALSVLNKNILNFDFCIVKFDKESESFSFIKSVDFDIIDEPTVGDAIKINKCGDLTITKEKKDPQIYHHKWNFVKDDYSGFSVKDSIKHSILWKEKIGTNKDISSRIGTRSFWNKTLADYGIINKFNSVKKIKV